jgi:hypothetical protein
MGRIFRNVCAARYANELRVLSELEVAQVLAGEHLP